MVTDYMNDVFPRCNVVTSARKMRSVDKSSSGRWDLQKLLHLLPRWGRLNRVSLLDREAETGGCRKSHDGVCTVRGKVTLRIHEEPCKLVSIPADKSCREAAAAAAAADCRR